MSTKSYSFLKKFFEKGFSMCGTGWLSGERLPFSEKSVICQCLLFVPGKCTPIHQKFSKFRETF